MAREGSTSQRRQKTKKRGSSKKSSRKQMYTHRAADGKSGAEYEASSEAAGYLVRADTNEEDDIAESLRCKPTCLRKTRNFIIMSFIVLLGQVLISVSLKRIGWIERDFNEIVSAKLLPQIQLVSDAVVPQLQQQLEYAWPQFNESIYWQRINQSISMSYTLQEPSRPGYQLAQKGAKPKYPIVMIPGFVTSGLEVWAGKECAKKYFRQRMWGGTRSVQHWLMERQCVLEHLALDPLTGKDPEDIRIRPAQGFEAADYFMGNYWVWGKILENLADIGYDGSMMSMESYDWRLAFSKLEERDGFLTKLKYKIEAFHKASGKKVILTSHSLGALLVHYFFAWVTRSEKDGGGGGGPDWVDMHIHTYINIAGAQLGVPKAATALLSGEMSDTIFMGAAGSLVEQFIGRKIRRDLWITWGSLWSMLPKGGGNLWSVGADIPKGESETSENSPSWLITMTGDETDASVEDLDDLTCSKEDLVDESTEMFVNQALRSFATRRGQEASDVIDFLKSWGGGMGPNISPAKLHSFDSKKKITKTNWHDVTKTPLPRAPKMKIYCLYGVGIDTERSYYYKRNTGEGQGADENASVSQTRKVETPFVLDTSIEDPDKKVVHGVRYVDGDASVPLLSLGYMCGDAWRRKDSGLNPSGAKVVTREYQHKGEFSVDMRGGPYSADHVDILGNLDMMEDFLKIVSEFEIEEVEDHIVSDIIEIANEINSSPLGGLKRRKKWRF